MPGVSGVNAPSRRWEQAGEETRVTKPGARSDGPSAEQTKAAQRAQLMKGLGKTAQNVGIEIALLTAKAGSGVGAGALTVVLGPIYTGYKHFEASHRAYAEGQELRTAYERDAVNLAFVWTAAEALPAPYVARKGAELRSVGGERGGAMKIVNHMMRDNATWQAAKKEASTHVEVGRRSAARLEIRSPSALESRLKNDPAFASAYSTSLGFRHGVDSIVFEQEQRRLYGGR